MQSENVSNTRSFSKKTKIITFLTVVSAMLILTVASNIWLNATDPQGGEGGGCFSENYPSVSNASGWIASSFNTVCSGFGGNSAIYVHLHRVSEKQNSDTLIFRYSDEVGVPRPKIEWIRPDLLHINVGNVSQVTKQITKVDNISVVYSIGHEKYQRK